MISTAIVNRYASALVDVILGPDSGVTAQQAAEQLHAFDAVVNGSSDLRLVLASPAVSAARKRGAIRRIAEVLGLAAPVRNFLLVLSDHRRFAGLSQIIGAFELLLDERMGFVRAEVSSAYDLSADQQNLLETELSRLAGKQVRMRFTVDTGLIGGVAARIGSKVYDGSVRGQLAGLRQRLALQRN